MASPGKHADQKNVVLSPLVPSEIANIHPLKRGKDIIAGGVKCGTYTEKSLGLGQIIARFNHTVILRYFNGPVQAGDGVTVKKKAGMVCCRFELSG